MPPGRGHAAAIKPYKKSLGMPLAFLARPSLLLLLLLLLLPAVPGAAAFYLPGAAPADYAPGESLGVMAVKLASARRPLPCVLFNALLIDS